MNYVEWANKYAAKYTLKRVGNIRYLAPIGEVEDEKKLVKLNSTGAFIWNALCNGNSIDNAASILYNEYNISLEYATDEILRFISYCEQHL